MSAADTAVAYMLRQVGKPYVWGGTGPRGYDCSGLGYMGYKSAGVTIPRATGGQQYAGKDVKGGPYAVGDAIFPHAGHVVWYIGSGKCVEAPHTGAFVRVIDTPTAWKARRFVGATLTKADLTGNIPLQQAGILGPSIHDINPLRKIGGAVTKAGDAAKSTADMVAWLTHGHNWFLVGEFLLGVMLLFVALHGFQKGMVPA